MKFAIIGAQGHWQDTIHAMNLDDSLCLCGVAPGVPGEDISPLSALDAPCFEDWEALVQAVKPDICVVNTVFFHNEPIAAALLRQGIHVYAEKPCATTLAQLDDLREAYAQGNAAYLAMLTYYYDPVFQKAADLVLSGAVGKARLISAQKSYRLGKRPLFYHDPALYGGTIPWVGIHAAAWAWQLSGGAAFQTASAMASAAHNMEHGALDVSCVMQLRMAGDILLTANIDYLRPEYAPSHGDDRLRVAGTEGIVEVRDGQVHLLNPSYSGVVPHADIPPDNIFAAFAASIAGSPARFCAQDCFAVTEAVLCAQQSALCGQIVQI